MDEYQSFTSGLAKERTRLAGERTRLAAERTLSAWIRTSLAVVGGGFAIVRYLEFQTFQHRLMAEAIGEVLMLLGIFILVFSLTSYTKSCKSLTGQEKGINNYWLATTVIVLIAVSILLFIMTITY